MVFYAFNIDRLWDYETDEEIESVSPGKQDKKLKFIYQLNVTKTGY